MTAGEALGSDKHPGLRLINYRICNQEQLIANHSRLVEWKSLFGKHGQQRQPPTGRKLWQCPFQPRRGLALTPLQTARESPPLRAGLLGGLISPSPPGWGAKGHSESITAEKRKCEETGRGCRGGREGRDRVPGIWLCPSPIQGPMVLQNGTESVKMPPEVSRCLPGLLPTSTPHSQMTQQGPKATQKENQEE